MNRQGLYDYWVLVANFVLSTALFVFPLVLTILESLSLSLSLFCILFINHKSCI